MLNYAKSALEIFGIVFLRFRLIPRIWNVWLVGVNLACLYFIQHVEAQVVLATTLLAVAVMSVIYNASGFTRLLGVAHLLWIPMFLWIATRFDAIHGHSDLQNWLLLLLVTNFVSFVVDMVDVGRYVGGESLPSYQWKEEPEFQL